MKRNIQKYILILCGLALALPVQAEPSSTTQTTFKPGDCVIFREGGEGWVLKAPTYWLKGTVTGFSVEQKMTQICPVINKQEYAYSSEDWAKLAEASPCVDREEDIREVAVPRMSVRVEEWESAWTRAQGKSGWLFKGRFLGHQLNKGDVIFMNPDWVESCTP